MPWTSMASTCCSGDEAAPLFEQTTGAVIVHNRDLDNAVVPVWRDPRRLEIDHGKVEPKHGIPHQAFLVLSKSPV